jgi:hypothetical protein
MNMNTHGVFHARVFAQPPDCRKDVRKWMYEFRGCTRMYEFLVVLEGGGQRFFWLLRDEAARLVLKLRAGARRAARPSALGGRINGLKGKKGEAAGMSLGVVAERTWCYA